MNDPDAVLVGCILLILPLALAIFAAALLVRWLW